MKAVFLDLYEIRDSAIAVCISCEESTSSLCRLPNRDEISSYTCEADVPKQWLCMTGRKFRIQNLSDCVASICDEVDQVDLIDVASAFSSLDVFCLSVAFNALLLILL